MRWVHGTWQCPRLPVQAGLLRGGAAAGLSHALGKETLTRKRSLSKIARMPARSAYIPRAAGAARDRAPASRPPAGTAARACVGGGARASPEAEPAERHVPPEGARARRARQSRRGAPVGALTETLYQARAHSVVVSAGGPIALDDCDTAVAENGELLPSGRWQGVVHSLHVASTAGAPLQDLAQARVVAERGIEGDRYFDGPAPSRRSRAWAATSP